MAESRRVPRFGRVLEPKVPDKNEFLALVAGYGDRENTVYAVNLSKANLPPILKVDGIERAAPFKEERFSRALADSIGNNFSLQAADLTVNQITHAMRNEAEHDHTAASRSRPISRAGARPKSPVLPSPERAPESRPMSPISRIRTHQLAHPSWSSPSASSATLASKPQTAADPLEFKRVALDPYDLPSHNLDEQLTSHQRYWFYVSKGLPDEAVAKVTPETLRSIASRITPSPRRFDPKLQKALEAEVGEEHIGALKKAIVDYVLLDPEEEKRLHINRDELPSPWLTIAARAPVPWHDAIPPVREQLHKTLLVCHPMMRRLLSLFCTHYASLRVFHCSSLTPAVLPVNIYRFRSMVSESADEFRQKICNQWIPHVVNQLYTTKAEWYPVVNAQRDPAAAEEAYAKLDMFFRSLSTLMSNQMWSLFEQSLQSMDQFFMTQYGSQTIPKDLSQLGESSSISAAGHAWPVIAIRVVVQNTQVVTEPSSSEIEVEITSMYQDMLNALTKLPRVESQIFADIAKEQEQETATGNDSSTSAYKTYLSLIPAQSTASSLGAHLIALFRSHAALPTAWIHTTFLPFKSLLTRRIEKKLEEFIITLPTATGLSSAEELAAFETEIASITELSAAVQQIPDVIHLGLYQLDVSSAKQQLVLMCQHLQKKLTTIVCDRTRTVNLQICDAFERISAKVMKSATSIADVVNTLAYLEKVRETEIPELEGQISGSGRCLQFLLDYAILSEEDVKLNAAVLNWPDKIQPIFDLGQKRLSQKLNKAQEDVRTRRDKVAETLEELVASANKFQDYGLLAELPEYVRKLDAFQAKSDELATQIDQIHADEELLEWERTAFDAYGEMQQILEPYRQLWDTVATFQQQYSGWLNGPLVNMDYETLSESIDTMWRSLFKLTKTFADKAVPRKVADSIKNKLEKFKQYLPLVQVLRNPGLTERHWTQIEAMVGAPVMPGPTTTLAHIVELNISQHWQQLEVISESASKEHALNKAYLKMKSDWEPMAMTFVGYKETGTFIVASVEEIQALLDDQTVKTSTMRNSPFAKQFEQELVAWAESLVLYQDVLDCWLQVQSTWLYLEPIFTSEDIMAQMPTEGRKFRTVDRSWRDIMVAARINPAVRAVMKLPNLLGRLREAHAALEEIQHGLNEYLEKKRLHFPRFFFLSNDELLEILAETKDPMRVQPHLKKCFEGIASLSFMSSHAENGDAKIVGMCSNEGEKVRFKGPVDPGAAKGAVEKWLLSVEKMMQASVLQQVGESLRAFSETPRETWVLQWPGQVVLCVSQIFWTREVTEAIRSGGPDGLRAYRELCTRQLEAIVNLVRTPQSAMARMTLSALVVIDVHARDVVAQLEEESVDSEDAFAWLSQLRYYWEDDDVAVRMINATLKYGHEYLGNSARLVITPLTDRCYRTLIGALELNLGGAPEGPAGTGKTETVKDLAKAIAKQCVVYNCSDGLDYLAMGKFFKGLASSGAWACFDEFNRIDLEVLSVVAQQILTIQRAIIARVDKFVFEGTTLGLNPTCSTFITMNPGYAGRSELPDNLKALFRPVAMMVPDYALIAEISLYSVGFIEARPLSRKIVATYKLCSEQLSSQDHYDYGMRAVKAVLTAAGNLKIRYPDEDESIIMLRSIKDVNMAKFLAQDLPLFQAITSDLFPQVVLPQPDYADLIHHLKSEMAKENLEPVPNALNKMIQVYEMMCIRHGYMLVGQPWSGKTVSTKILGAALTSLAQANPSSGEKEVNMRWINPKSITMGQLYGQFDAITHEWTDGILATIFREYASAGTSRRSWIIFDGPVDAIWIENMNTVLDDNKKLCLTSGEIMSMSNTMSVQFEVADLAVASPATVSRCGMIYMEPALIGWRPLTASWLRTMTVLAQPQKNLISTIFEALVDPLLDFVRTSCREYVATLPGTAISTCQNLIEYQINQIVGSLPSGVKPTFSASSLTAMALFALIWGLGGGVNFPGRALFDKAFRDLLASPIQLVDGADGEMPRFDFPDTGLVYDHFWDENGTAGGKRGAWRDWQSTLTKYEIPARAKLSQIQVPTIETARYGYLLDLFLKNSGNMLLVGPTGTGKTAYINHRLLSMTSHRVIFVNFSAQTTAQDVLEIVLGKLDKRRKSVFGPPQGTKCVVFLDDLNMPAKEKYGAQPPLELVRQFLDHGMWYDTQALVPIQLVDISLMAAMGEPGGGRSVISNRVTRHFSTFGITEFDTPTLMQIFGTIMQWHLTSASFTTAVQSLAPRLVAATCSIYRDCVENLYPTPTKGHYLFNLRDFSRVVEGLLLMTPEKFTEPTKTQRLWVHEVFRVFYDRLVTPEDRVWFFGAVKQQLSDHFRVEADTLFEHLRRPGSTEPLTDEDLRGNVFGDFGAPTGAATSAAKGYDQVDEMDLLSSFIRSRLDEFNQVSKAPMQLIIFRFAAEHIARIARALRQPGGHMLLVGMGGSGRQSLTRLAAYMADYPLFSIEITKSYSIKDWREDIKKILIKAGGQPSQPVVFMLNDTQIKYESFLEDINNLLNTGDVPNLFEPEEKAALIEAMRSVWATMPNFSKNTIMTPNMLYNIFVDRVKENLHVVLCMSPVGDAFRSRLRKFPSIVNCCTIDWFQAWPADALEMVAQRALDRLGLSDSEKVVVVQMCREFHMDTIQLSEQFYTQLRRQNYVTPMSYLNLIRVFSRLLQTKRQEIEARKGRYVTGLSQLASASSQVSVMQTELENLQPQLIKTGEETAEMMKIIERETIQVNEKRALVQVDERAANLKADAARAIKEDCEAQLAEALPALEEAMSALDILKPQDISLVKSMKNPPFPVKLVMEAICIMRGIKPARVKVNGKMVEDFWGPAQKLLSDSHFLQDLKAYDKDNIDPKIIERIRKTYISNAEFDPDIVKNSSSAAEGLCRWIRAMDKYEAVSKVVKPKKAALAVAEDELNTEMVKLRSKQAELKEVEDKMASLQAQFEQMTAKKADLEAQVKLCGEKLVRAEQLIGGLGGEKSRWQASAEELDTRLTTIVGDMLLSSGIIAYLGAFTASFRVSVIKKWMASLKAKGLTASQNYSLPAVIGDQVVIRNWQLAGLPSDAFSTENALIANNSDGWPLFIDPQGQANKWVKQLEKERLVVIKPTDADYMRQLETAVQFGKPILLEDVGEELDAALEPLLLRQTFKQGGVLCIKLGETVVEYSPDFHLYISTKIRNPRYMPELTTKVTLINFMLTPEGLEDQLLSIVAAQERPELEKEKNELVIASAANNEQLAEIENSILGILTKSQGNLLEDESAINALTNSKLISDKIAEKQKVASVTEKEIDLTRQGYRPIAKHGSVLFFAIADLANIEPMYQYSLVWFVGIFLASISDAPKSDVLEERLSGLTKHFTYSLYCNVCRSVFKKDKLLFSFLLTVSIQREAGDMTADEWSFFLSGVGAIPQEKQLKNPHPEIISTAIWLDLQLLAAKVPAFGRSLLESFSHPDDIILWRNVLESSEPWGERLPRGWSESTKPFQRLLLLKIMRLDKLIGSVTEFVRARLGRRYIDPPPFDLAASFADSHKLAPLIFILSPGSDIMTGLLKFAEDRGFGGAKLQSISLGQGQGPVAAQMIKNAVKSGTWVILQNCHLAVSWLPALEKMVEDWLPEAVHKDFRLWLTSYPSDRFPVSLLQNGVKMTNEPPAGLRANLLRSFTSDPISGDKFLSTTSKSGTGVGDLRFAKLLHGLCFFHALVQERKTFGPLGWNIPYEFNDSDLQISLRQLQKLLREYPEPPWKALSYLTGECNYGGRVTDDNDRRTLMGLLSIVYTPELLDADYKLSSSGLYSPPGIASMDPMIRDIQALPVQAHPEVFGLHENANITKDFAEANQLILSAQASVTSSSTSGGSATLSAAAEDALTALTTSILDQLPPNFDIDAVQKQFPVKYEDSMNTVLVQELVRYNRLLTLIRSSLVDVKKALKGLIVMSRELEEMTASMALAKIPEMWLSRSYPSLKPLGGYISDFINRLAFMQKWIDDGRPPNVFWISGFYFTQSFLAGILQNYARKHQLPIDILTFRFEVTKHVSDADITSTPESGVYIRGFYLEGARWNVQTNSLGESLLKKLLDPMPIIHIVPCPMNDPILQQQIASSYECPVYRTSARRGTLSTTGHSTNFVMRILLKTTKPTRHWVNRGVAVLLSTSEA